MSEQWSTEAAEQAVQHVTSWYTEQIRKRQRSGEGPEVLQALKEGLAACAADLETLQEGGEEAAEIGARYAALAQELEGQ
ncbi:hypothetical protein EES37_37830 [Streptomyces sp. ADI91-18]|uniref:hypothetical protein n=1 Tax=unclassified Streptomyces TaxID=2593676 RepID=UPI000F5547CD|nr:hypothetical protein [Streptomyces sp. ADI91-18]RPK23519.1 hypothetical protein EES37_37830 [Streptomyces sp. ADI91-18]